jgi:hypothetical protein
MAVNVGMESAITIPGHLFCLMHHNPPFRVSIECDLLQANNTNNKPRPESPRWLVHEGFYEEARTVVAQTNADGDPSNPIVLTVYKEILDTLEWEKKEGRTMSPKEIFKTPVARKRLLIGMSAGPFSCVAGNIIASYYLGSELNTAGITNSNDQLKAVRARSLDPTTTILIRAERRTQRMVSRLRPGRNPTRREMGPQSHRPALPVSTRTLPFRHRRPLEALCR